MMRKFFLLTGIVFLCSITKAQRSIEGLIDAEKSFAAYSVANGTKDAFLKFLDSSGIIFDQGKPVNGIESWAKREKRPGILNWFPQYAEIAYSNDFGFTTGPWTFKPSPNDSVVTRGNYSTVWHINEKGEWKFLIDLGVSNTPEETDSFIIKEIKPIVEFEPGTGKSLIKMEKRFIKASHRSTKDAYQKYKSSVCYLNRNKRMPAWFEDAFYGVYDSMPKKNQYTINGSGIASTGDLGYVYGSTIINGKTDNYLRIWRKEQGGWKIALEVLRY